MGLLSQMGETLSYEKSKQLFQEIKQNGLIQFLKLYQKFHLKKLANPPVLWGDEIEFHIINLNPKTKEAKIQCDISYVYKKFTEIAEKETQEFEIQPEYGAWMLETVPNLPFKYCCDLIPVIKNMAIRREVIQSILNENDMIFTIPVFPLLGTPHSFSKTNEIPSYEEYKSNETINGLCSNDKQNPITNSIFIDDEIINSHPRFPALTKNIRERRGEKVVIKVPLFIDEKTETKESLEEPYPGFIYMDAMAFGMGNCCLQVTFSTRDIDHARFFYDQLGILAPLILPLTVGSAIFKGKLADTDARWDSIVASVDDRNSDERNPNHEKFIPKSRYDTISFFISNDKKFFPEYNDLRFPVEKNLMEFVKQQEKELDIEIDDNLLQHLGFLFIRDPLVIFKNRTEDPNDTSDFENIQSTNWNSVRFKPPPSLNSTVNWRVEFRPMEVQLTDEENALFSFLILRIVRMLSFDEFNLNFYLPISYVDKNFQRAVKKNAILQEKFFIRKNIFDDGKPEIIEVYLHEFFFGNKEFIGLQKILSLFNDFFKSKINVNLSSEYLQQCEKQNAKVFEYLKDKTNGKKLTLASWIRKFVQTNPLYMKDSIVTKEIAFDLLKQISEISHHKIYDYNFDFNLNDK